MIAEVSEPAGAPRYEFTHALVRQTLYDELSLPRKQRLHSSAGDAIERVFEHNLQTHAMDLAFHFRQAGAAASPDRTVAHLSRAAELAADLQAWEDSSSLNEAILQIWREHGADAAELAGLLVRHSDTQYLMNDDYDRQVAHLEEALDIYQQLSDERRIGQVRSRLGRVLHRAGEFRQAEAEYRRALDSLRDEPPGVPLAAVCVGTLEAST